ncbi:hypothetical protein TRIUR3_02100 [Triticum urartu]|uniref:Uncharacterized protein n=1 Tax=Triticum urartu TaxID=4572 RepID=M7ZZS6_TRIUA|nr:hypothetical protein TRIUR3_02100 [Triticum urartu]
MASPLLVLLKPGTVDDAPASPAAQAVVRQPPPAPAVSDGAEHLLQGPEHLGGGRPDGSWSTLEPTLADNMVGGNQMLTSSSKSFPGHVIRNLPAD